MGSLSGRIKISVWNERLMILKKISLTMSEKRNMSEIANTVKCLL